MYKKIENVANSEKKAIEFKAESDLFLDGVFVSSSSALVKSL